MTEIRLTQLLDHQYGGAVAPDGLTRADQALLAGDFLQAANLYASKRTSTQSARAKHGYCLAMSGDDVAAEKLLTLKNVGTHPVARTILAWALAGRRGRRLRGFGSPQVMQEREQRRANVDALLTAALAAERPPVLVFMAAFDVYGTQSDGAGALAARARLLHPNWAWPHAIHAGIQRGAGELDPAMLDDLMRTLPSARQSEVFHEAFTYALMLCRWDDADRVVEALESLVRRDPVPGDGNHAVLAEMRSMVALHRARTGETDAYEAIPLLLAPFAGVSTYMADGPNPLAAPKFLLQVALETQHDGNVRDAALALADRAWRQEALDGEGLDSWSPLLSTPSIEGVVHFGHFGFEFTHAWRRIELLLDVGAARRWRLLVAADAVFSGDPDQEQIRVLRTADLRDGPVWISRAAFDAYADHEPVDFAGAGAVLAAIGERAAALAPPNDEAMFASLELMSIDMHGSDEVVWMFEGALAWLQATPAATGQGLLRAWRDCVLDNGGGEVLARIAALSLSRVDSALARESLIMAQEAEQEEDSPEVALQRTLANYPDPATTRVQPGELTLLEAATLIALMRASALDHVLWTLSPLQASGRRFEPTDKFIATLFGLMNKGVIAIDASTPAGVVEFRDDRLHAFLGRVVWRISAHTLELHRAVRDLPRQQWPEEWRSHAAVLARDLGVEELVVYLEQLLDERSLPIPDMNEVREIFRLQLERLAIAQCYYLAHKTVKETLDYQARYRSGAKQLQARTINLLRGNGEKAVTYGWNTRFERVRELPASLLYEALHDVLTGWGTRAFDEPVMTLALIDPDVPSTRR